MVAQVVGPPLEGPPGRLLQVGRALAPLSALSAVVAALATITLVWGRQSAAGFGPFGPAEALRVGAYGMYALVGALVAVRRPGNPVGWIFLVGGTAMTWQLGIEEYAHTAVVLEPGRWPVTAGIDWVAEWLWVVPMTSLQFATLLFPTGRLPSRRWRPVARMLLLGDLLLLILLPVATWPLRGRLAGEDMLLADSRLWPVIAPLAIAMAAAVVATSLSLVVRFRRASGDERLQLRWLAFAAVVFVIAAVIENAFGENVVSGSSGTPDGVARTVWPALVGAAGIVAIPVAAAFAILKRRLYELDRIISRLVAYALVSGVLAAGYLTLVLALGELARTVTGESGDLVVAVSTLAVAAAARPLLVRVRAAVDRRFDRARYDAAATIDAFGRGLRDEVELDVIVAELRGTATRTFAPQFSGVVLTGETRPR